MTQQQLEEKIEGLLEDSWDIDSQIYMNSVEDMMKELADYVRQETINEILGLLKYKDEQGELNYEEIVKELCKS